MADPLKMPGVPCAVRLEMSGVLERRHHVEEIHQKPTLVGCRHPHHLETMSDNVWCFLGLTRTRSSRRLAVLEACLAHTRPAGRAQDGLLLPHHVELNPTP